LIGPFKQFKQMMKPNRIIASLIFLGALALTLWAAFTVFLKKEMFQKKILC